jgi:hypothetical protein
VEEMAGPAPGVSPADAEWIPADVMRTTTAPIETVRMTFRCGRCLLGRLVAKLNEAPAVVCPRQYPRPGIDQ